MDEKDFADLVGESPEDMGIDLDEWDCGCDGIEPCEYCDKMEGSDEVDTSK